MSSILSAGIPPATPVFLGMIDHSIDNFTNMNTGGTSHDATPGVIFLSEIGDTYSMYDNGTLIGTMVATKANTNWTVPSALINGVHNLEIVATNAAGQTSDPLYLNLTVEGPPTPVFLGMIDHSIDNFTNTLSGGTSHDATPGVVFLSEIGDTYSMYDNGALIGTMVATKANTNWTVPSALINGVHNLEIVATNAAGLTSDHLSVSVTVDAGPAAPHIMGMVDHTISNYAEADMSSPTADAQPSLAMWGNAGDTLNIFDGGKLIQTVVMTSNNTLVNLPTLANGVHDLSITETSASGTSVPTHLTLTVDAPVATIPAAAPTPDETVHTAVGLNETFVASADHQAVDLAADPTAYFKQSTAHIEGGNTGAHALHLTGSNEVLDLTSMSGQTAAAKMSGIQSIDLGGHSNAINLSIVDVLNLGQTDLFQTDGNKQMMVNGSSGDTVNVLHEKVARIDDTNWESHGTTTVGGVVYNVYEHSGAHSELLVQQGVQVVVH